MATRTPKSPAEARRLAAKRTTDQSQAATTTTVLPGDRPEVEDLTIAEAVVSPPEKRRPGRPVGSGRKIGTLNTEHISDEEREASYARRLERTRAYAISASKTQRDIAPLPLRIDWDRRLACKKDLGLFAKTYLPNTFSLSWSDAHKVCIAKLETVFLDGGKFAVAMPRGDGKTALCRGAMLWGTLFGHRLFPFFIGSAQPKAQASLEYIKTALYSSILLRQDFPEVCYAAVRLENRTHLSRGQLFREQNTYIDWGSDSIKYPVLCLSREEMEYYELHDPGFTIHIPAVDETPDRWICKTAGITIQTAGVDGSIRGEAGVHPILLTQPRPDVALIDDVQKDNRVDSSLSCTKLKLLIDGAIGLLSGPTEPIAAIMPCTVMREGDVADTFVDPEKRPEWRGERHARVLSWPDGIDDEKITLDTPEGICWIEYDRLRKLSLRKFKDIRLATQYYLDNRETMDKGFTCSWSERYNPKTEVSPQQASMNLRLEIGSAVFMAECQNKGRKPAGEGIVPIRSPQLREKIVSLAQRVCPIDTRSLVVHIDVQNEIFYWVAFACSPDFTGTFVDYGTFPDTVLPYFRKAQTEEWSLLSRMFFEAYPDQRSKAKKSSHGYRAPLEAKIYHGLTHCLKHILNLNFVRDDPFKTPIHINRIGIDTRWGQTTDTIKRFVRDWSLSAGQPKPGNAVQQSGYVARDILVPYFGQGITALQKQFEEFTRTRGWLFEDEVSPTTKEVRWIWKPDAMGLYYLLVDVNRLKTFLFQRLASPPGSRGSVTLFNAPPERHELFCDSVCESEYPQVVQVMTTFFKKEMWKERENAAFDNDYLDCAAACMALASFNGAFLQHVQSDQPRPQTHRRLSDQWREKRHEA